jgi:enoyl-CoA hydratase
MFNAGLVTKVVDDDIYLDEAIELAKVIASKPSMAVQLAKECILKSFDSTIESGLEFERKNFYLLFGTEDKFEGMKAFVDKRKAEWKGK